jgi:hypothetical protein
MRHCCYSIHALLLALTASVLVITPSDAVRGKNKMMIRRFLQSAAEGSDVFPKPEEDKVEPAVVDKAEKEEKEDKTVKEEVDPKKGGKKDKMPCKKANDKGKKSKKDQRRSRLLQIVDDSVQVETFEGDVADLTYCSQGELSALQCADLANVPSDGQILSSLYIGLVHDEEKHPQTITDEVEVILNSGEIELRFVGCKNMDTPPPPIKGDDNEKMNTTKVDANRRRIVSNRSHRMLLDEEHEVIFKTAEEEIDVTGVNFWDLQIDRGGKLNVCEGVFERNRMTSIKPTIHSSHSSYSVR